MKISVDDVELYTLTTHQKDVLKYDIPSEIFDADLEARLNWVLTHLYEQSLKRLKKVWDPILTDREITIPVDPVEYADVVFAQPDYEDRSARILAEAT